MFQTIPSVPEAKRAKPETIVTNHVEEKTNQTIIDSSGPNSPNSAHSPDILADESSETYNDDADSPITNSEYLFFQYL